MEDNAPVHPDYIKGYNDGYVIAQYMPELVQALSKSTGATDKMNGLRDGCTQYLKEYEKTNLPEWLRKDRLDKFDINKDDLEKDNYDRE